MRPVPSQRPSSDLRRGRRPASTAIPLLLTGAVTLACQTLMQHPKVPDVPTAIGSAEEIVREVTERLTKESHPGSPSPASPSSGQPGSASDEPTLVSRQPGQLGSMRIWTVVADDIPISSSSVPLSNLKALQISDSGTYALLLRSSDLWVGREGEMTRRAGAGSPVQDLEVMGIVRPTPSELKATPYAPAMIERIDKFWLAEDGSIGIAAVVRSSAMNVGASSVESYCLATESGIVPVALAGSEEPIRVEQLNRGNGYVEIRPAKSSLELVRGIDSGACDGMTESREFLLYGAERSILIAAASGTSRTIAQLGAGPGLPANITISGFDGSAMAAGDDVLFSARLAGPGLQKPFALYVSGDQGLELLGRIPLAAGSVGPKGHVTFADGNEVLAGRPGAMTPVQTTDGKRLRPSSLAAPISWLAEGRVLVGIKEAGLELWSGPPEGLTRVAIPTVESLGLAGASVQGIREWKTASGFLAVTLGVTENINGAVYSGTVLLAGPPEGLVPILVPRQRVEIAPGDSRLMTGLTLLDVSARGELLIEASFEAEEGVRNKSKAVLVVDTRTSG